MTMQTATEKPLNVEELLKIESCLFCYFLGTRQDCEVCDEVQE